MAKRSPKRREPDFNQLAQNLVRKSTEEPGPVAVPTKSEISRVMAELGRRGGKIGGKKRAEKLSPRRRREIAVKAAHKRWGKPKRRVS
jgi:hypothetical protein